MMITVPKKKPPLVEDLRKPFAGNRLPNCVNFS